MPRNEPRQRSAASHAILDEETRLRKASKIIAVLQSKIDLGHCRVLDIGTGAGYIAARLAEIAGSVDSVDIVDERRVKSGYTFHQTPDSTLPFESGSFDVIISNHVIEHLVDQRRHLLEIHRTLRQGGLLYLATPNKFWVSDPHYRLPLLPVLPRDLSSQLIRWFGRGTEWDVYPLSHFDIRRLAEEFRMEPVVPRLLKFPDEMQLDMASGITRFTRTLPYFLLKPSQYISPTLIYLARKEQATT